MISPGKAIACFIYIAGVVLPGFWTATASCNGVRAPWVPAPFYTDGVLMWFLPVVTVLPILLWPASLVVWGMIVAYRRASKAERFCGISRWRLRRGCRELRERWWRGGYRPVDVEQPLEGVGVSSAEHMVVASSSTDDEGGAESPVVRKPLLLTGDKNMHGGCAPTSPTRGSDEESLESGPPAYEL